MPAIDRQLISECRCLCDFIEPLSGLAENLQVTNDRVLERARGKNRFPAGCRVLDNPANAFENMLDIRALRLHRGTASRRTDSRIRGLRDRRITTWTRRPKSCSRSAAILPGNHGVVSPVTSTRKSTSLSSVSSPRATDPKRRTLQAPCLVATRRMSSRRSLMCTAMLICLYCIFGLAESRALGTRRELNLKYKLEEYDLPIGFREHTSGHWLDGSDDISDPSTARRCGCFAIVSGRIHQTQRPWTSAA